MSVVAKEWVRQRVPKTGILAFLLVIPFFFLYIWRLGTLTPGVSSHELSARNASATFSRLKTNPINAPHKLIQLLFQQFGHHGAFWMRSVSVFFAFVFLMSTFLLLKQWFGNSIALAGSILLAATPWVVIMTRNESPDILLLSPILIIYTCTAFLRAKKRRNLAWLGLMIVAAFSVYIPGMVWFLVISLVIEYKRFLQAFFTVSSVIAVLGLTLFILLITPLMIAIYKNHLLLKDLLLIPLAWHGLVTAFKWLAKSFLTLIFKAQVPSDYLIGRLAILSIAQSILALVGLYAMSKSARREALSLLVLVLIGIFAAAANQNIILLSICLPPLVIFDSAALRFLYLRWLRVFPLNPIPRFFAAALISLLIVLQLAYGASYTLAAWPHTLETRHIYMLK